MKFTNSALFVLATLPSINGFVNPTKNQNGLIINQSTNVKFGVPLNICGSSRELGKSILSMSEATAEETEVPSEVESLDGVADETEAHNVDRPARASGIQKHKQKKIGKPLSEFTVGSTVEGTVKTTTSYGAFIDIGAATDALLHVSRMSDDFVSNVEDVMKAGDVISVRIAAIDEEKKQISLTRKSEESENRVGPSGKQSPRRQRPSRSDGDREAQREALNKLSSLDLSEEKFVEGEVVSTLSFGAFVRVDTSQFDPEVYSGEVDGLVHISALSADRVNAVEDVINVGEKVQVRIKLVDVEGGKISLSMITKEVEEASGKRGGDRGEKRGGGGKSLFKESEMGPKDWKDQMERVLANQGEFQNLPIIVDKRK